MAAEVLSQLPQLEQLCVRLYTSQASEADGPALYDADLQH